MSRIQPLLIRFWRQSGGAKKKPKRPPGIAAQAAEALLGRASDASVIRITERAELDHGGRMRTQKVLQVNDFKQLANSSAAVCARLCCLWKVYVSLIRS